MHDLTTVTRRHLGSLVCVQCRAAQPPQCTAAYAEVSLRALCSPTCSHGPFCAKCRRGISRCVLSSCVCRALVDSWRETTWPSSVWHNGSGATAHGSNGISAFPVYGPDQELDLADALAADLDADIGPAPPPASAVESTAAVRLAAQAETETGIGPALPLVTVLGPAAAAARLAAESETVPKHPPEIAGHPNAATAYVRSPDAAMRLIAAAAAVPDVASRCASSLEHSVGPLRGANLKSQADRGSGARHAEISGAPHDVSSVLPVLTTTVAPLLPSADVRRRSLFANADLDEELLIRVRVAQAAESLSVCGSQVSGGKVAPGLGKGLTIFKRSGPMGDRPRKGAEDDTVNHQKILPSITVPVPAAKKRRVITAGQSDGESDSAD